MISVFKKFAPRYKKIVRRLALDAWKERLTKKREREFYEDAELFKNRYARELEKHYRESGIRIFRGTITAKANQWLEDQTALVESIKVVTQAKKEKINATLFEKLKTDKTGDVQKLLNKIYLPPGDNADVYKVFSFADSLEDRAEQIGEQSAFDLGNDVNDAVIKSLGDAYLWQTQEDKVVRKTHKMLNKKTFLFSDPPTTIDKYGNKHKGNVGTDYGCVHGSTRLIFDSSIKFIYRRSYRGKLTFIVTSIGVLYLTPNHPILTSNGWIGAQNLKLFDKIAKVPGEVENRVKSNKAKWCFTATDVFDFFSLRLNKVRVSGATHQFHSDGVPQKKIDIISIPCKLMNVFNILGTQKNTELFFSHSDKMRGFNSFSPQSNATTKLIRLFFSSSLFVSALSQSFFFAIGHFFKSKMISFGTVSHPETFFRKKFNYGAARDNELFRNSKNAISSDKTGRNFLAANSNDFVRVLFCGEFFHSCLVYNFETESNYYFANEMASHNCRCYAMPPGKSKPLRRFVADARKS